MWEFPSQLFVDLELCLACVRNKPWRLLQQRQSIYSKNKQGGCGDFDVLETNGKKIKSEVYVYVL